MSEQKEEIPYGETDVWWDIFWEGKREGIEWAEGRSEEEIETKIKKLKKWLKEHTPSAREVGFLNGLEAELEARRKGWKRR